MSTSFILAFATLIQLCPAPFIPAIVAGAADAAAIAADAIGGVIGGAAGEGAIGSGSGALSGGVGLLPGLGGRAAREKMTGIHKRDAVAALEAGQISEAEHDSIVEFIDTIERKRSSDVTEPAVVGRSSPSRESFKACWAEALKNAPQVVMHNSTSITLTNLHGCWTDAIKSATG